MTRTALYRHFDAAGQLLYVGISLNSIQRTAQHRHGAAWFEQIARITIVWHPTRESAQAAEASAISRERPKWNVVRPLFCGQRHRVAVRHAQSGRLDGWYSAETGEHMLGWFRAVFPGEQFDLVGPAPRDNFLHRDRVLRASECGLWAATAPDYAAGNTFDEQAAA